MAQARRIWLALVDGGNAEAAYRLGLLAELGRGTAQDTTEAYRWYRRAAESGHAVAEFNVAIMEDSGRGTAHDIADAAAWYGRAAARGNSRAQYDLGLLYETGEGVPRNPAAARAWFHLAAASGLSAASAKLDDTPDQTQAALPAQSAAAASAAPLLPAIPVAPAAGGVVGMGPDRSIEIVWSAPRQPLAVRYFLQVVTRDGGPEREIQAEYVTATAAILHLDPAAQGYFWRVFTVSPAQARYVVTPWAAFGLRGRV